MSKIAYYRVSTGSQSIATQRAALTEGITFDKEFQDEGVSGAIPAMHRPGFAAMSQYIREGDTLYVYAVDRLGRDAIDVQTTVKALLARGVIVEVRGLGRIAGGAGELIIAVLAQVADMERQRIIERTTAGRELAKVTHAATGRTHKGKATLGRPATIDDNAVKAWKETNKATVSATAKHFQISESSVKRACK